MRIQILAHVHVEIKGLRLCLCLKIKKQLKLVSSLVTTYFDKSYSDYFNFFAKFNIYLIQWKT